MSRAKYKNLLRSLFKDSQKVVCRLVSADLRFYCKIFLLLWRIWLCGELYVKLTWRRSPKIITKSLSLLHMLEYLDGQHKNFSSDSDSFLPKLQKLWNVEMALQSSIQSYIDEIRILFQLQSWACRIVTSPKQIKFCNFDANFLKFLYFSEFQATFITMQTSQFHHMFIHHKSSINRCHGGFQIDN